MSCPKFFYILDSLRKDLPIPVWHDDQQGTAAVILAAAINALKFIGKKFSEARFTIIGAGAANTRTFYVLQAAGVKPSNILIADSSGIISYTRDDLKGSYKWDMANKSNPEGIEGGIKDAAEGSDILIAASKSGPNVITKSDLEGMASNPIVFACANPIPEIWPWEAKEAGIRIVATGRSDFPNQVNNRYPEHEFEIEYNDDQKKLLLGKLVDMKKAIQAGEAHRNHDRPGKCRFCSRREVCPEKLA